ncbi:MAG: OmpA family protein [Symploca sp. SIO2E9]|nr:OmpA family protein [Symploca sp. SIO2E9]
MSKRDNPLVLTLALLITIGVIGGSLWLLLRRTSKLITGVPEQSGTSKLTLLGDTFSGYSTFRSNEFQKALKEVGINLTYQDEFDQQKRTQLLNQRKADLFVTTLDQFLKHKPQGKIVGLIDRTVGADAVVLNTKKYPNLNSLLDLSQLIKQQRKQGKKLSIAFAGDTPSEYLALVLSTKFEAFNLSDFEIKEVADASEAWQMLQDNQKNVAVAVLWEPFVTQAQQNGYTVVLSSKDAPKVIVDVIVASEPLIKSQPSKISELLESYYRRIDANVRQPSQLQRQIAEDGKLSDDEAASVLRGIDFFTAVEAKDWMTDGTLEKRIASTAAVLVLAGEMNERPQTPNQLFTSQFVNQAASNTQTLIDIIRADNPELADKLQGKGSTIGILPSSIGTSQIKTAPDIGNLQVRGEVKFGLGSAQLTAVKRDSLNNLAQEIGEFNEQTVAVRVIGHTSKTGSADVNQKLSEQRAQVVVNYLRTQGLKHNFLAEGKGFYLPLSGIPSEDPRQQRTEIRLVRIN